MPMFLLPALVTTALMTSPGQESAVASVEEKKIVPVGERFAALVEPLKSSSGYRFTLQTKRMQMMSSREAAQTTGAGQEERDTKITGVVMPQQPLSLSAGTTEAYRRGGKLVFRERSDEADARWEILQVPGANVAQVRQVVPDDAVEPFPLLTVMTPTDLIDRLAGKFQGMAVTGRDGAGRFRAPLTKEGVRELLPPVGGEIGELGPDSHCTGSVDARTRGGVLEKLILSLSVMNDFDDGVEQRVITMIVTVDGVGQTTHEIPEEVARQLSR